MRQFGLRHAQLNVSGVWQWVSWQPAGPKAFDLWTLYFYKAFGNDRLEVASPETILRVDLYGTALVLEVFGNVIARGGSGIVIASQSGHRLGPLSTEQKALLATTPAEELVSLPMLQLDQIKDSLHAYQISKRGNSLRVMAEAVRWGKRGARVNTISPGIIITPLANDELKGPRGPGYRRMIEVSAVGRAGTPDEVGVVGALLMGPEGAFITGGDFLMDGGVTAAYWYGDLAPK